MNLPITKRQKDMLSILYSYIKDTGYPPTFGEMKDRLGVASNQSVVDLLNKLEAKKIIKKGGSTARSIAILPLGYELLGRPPLVPFLGITHAGAPIDAIAIEGQWETLSSDVARLQEDVFLLKISGDSMINAGIDDGDIVLVRTQKEFVSGDIVLARIGNESTVKRFMSEDKPPYLYLKPENPNHEVIYFTEEVVLEGKVISILKNGGWGALI
ncbi:MAG: repressor LexA [Candidatus Levybacteria bacterium RIFCSPHIGHO2_01_FULL_40_15b]|nr:MAG: repressor LexA [Candidatus Levybacteria bacterium RIFCSPHIGHO2_01_FULL_40_15b]